jgi:sulfite reductase (NADPH) flavoprotein alpha-component
VRYETGGRLRKGLASNFLAERVAEGAAVPVYIQKAHGFAPPGNGATPIIMVGPGTGVAPFRAFLQERLARKASGRSWLFFGHQHEKTDFFYRDELDGFLATGTLTRLTTAWSRDGDRKIYVQDRMREAGDELFRWLEDGAHFYVCGDASRMAADVDRALRDIVANHGGVGAEAADAYVDRLIEAGRYQRDVY